MRHTLSHASDPAVLWYFHDITRIKVRLLRDRKDMRIGYREAEMHIKLIGFVVISPGTTAPGRQGHFHSLPTGRYRPQVSGAYPYSGQKQTEICRSEGSRSGYISGNCFYSLKCFGCPFSYLAIYKILLKIKKNLASCVSNIRRCVQNHKMGLNF